MEIIQAPELFRRNRFMVGNIHHFNECNSRSWMGRYSFTDIYHTYHIILIWDAFIRKVFRRKISRVSYYLLLHVSIMKMILSLLVIFQLDGIPILQTIYFSINTDTSCHIRRNSKISQIHLMLRISFIQFTRSERKVYTNRSKRNDFN